MLHILNNKTENTTVADNVALQLLSLIKVTYIYLYVYIYIRIYTLKKQNVSVWIDIIAGANGQTS